MKKWLKKLIKTVLIIVITLTVLNIGVSIGLNAWGESGGGEIPYVVKSALASFNKFASNSKVEEFKKLMGGTARGVCHPKNDEYNVSLLEEANINWVRFDIPSESPYLIDSDGNAIKDQNGNYQEIEDYKNFKERCMIYQNKGIKVMAITPYPDDMLNEVGELEVFNTGGEFSEKFINFMKEVSAYYANDLKGYVNAFQISNELTVDKWMGALTTDQVCYYQGELQMKVMYPITHEAGIPIGFNICGYTLYDYPKQVCDTYGPYFDYIALDLYLGCFEGDYHTTIIYDLLLRNLYTLSGCKPVMLNEFGYISAGNTLSDEEKPQYLESRYGEEFNSEEKIRNNIVAFLDKFDEVSGDLDGSPMTNEARRVIAENGGENEPEALKAAADYILGKEQISHIYRSLPEDYKLTNYAHTQEGQAEFYEDTIKRLSSLDFICGYFVYCYSDSKECYQCSQEDCPVETGWGLVSIDNDAEVYNETTVTKKPSFYAIQRAYERLEKKDGNKYNK